MTSCDLEEELFLFRWFCYCLEIRTSIFKQISSYEVNACIKLAFHVLFWKIQVFLIIYQDYPFLTSILLTATNPPNKTQNQHCKNKPILLPFLILHHSPILPKILELHCLKATQGYGNKTTTTTKPTQLRSCQNDSEKERGRIFFHTSALHTLPSWTTELHLSCYYLQLAIGNQPSPPRRDMLIHVEISNSYIYKLKIHLQIKTGEYRRLKTLCLRHYWSQWMLQNLDFLLMPLSGYFPSHCNTQPLWIQCMTLDHPPKLQALRKAIIRLSI